MDKTTEKILTEIFIKNKGYYKIDIKTGIITNKKTQKEKKPYKRKSTGTWSVNLKIPSSCEVYSKKGNLMTQKTVDVAVIVALVAGKFDKFPDKTNTFVQYRGSKNILGEENLYTISRSEYLKQKKSNINDIKKEKAINNSNRKENEDPALKGYTEEFKNKIKKEYHKNGVPVHVLFKKYKMICSKENIYKIIHSK